MNTEASNRDFETLYHRAFADYKLRALWNLRELEHPTPEQALAITRSLCLATAEVYQFCGSRGFQP